jgi:hypothetical protein
LGHVLKVSYILIVCEVRIWSGKESYQTNNGFCEAEQRFLLLFLEKEEFWDQLFFLGFDRMVEIKSLGQVFWVPTRRA